MDHLNSIRAALKGTAPVLAIPVPGHAPVCIRAKLLKGALKGVTIDSVEITETRWLKIKGHAGKLEKQLESLYPPVQHQWHSQEGCYYLDSWINKRPKEQAYSIPYSWRDRHDDEETSTARLKRIAERLKNARADIRDLTPPQDEETTQEQIAA